MTVPLNKGLRTTLRWDPVSTLYCNIESIPKSLLPSQTTGRVAPKDRSTLEDEHSKFCNTDRISNFEVNKSLCPAGYQLKKDENEAIFYKIEPHSVLSVPQVSETTVVDKMLHVKLFSVASPIPLPEWFWKGSDCCLRKKSMLENFPSYIRNFVEVKKLPDYILSELELIQYKKPVDKPKYSVNMLRYALLLRFTSVQSYKLLLQQFALPSLSLLKKTY